MCDVESVSGATTAEKLSGTKFWVPTPGHLPRARSKAGLGVGCGRSPPSPCEVPGCYPRKSFENLDAKSCILVTLAVKYLAFWKLRPKRWGTDTLLVPNLKVGGSVSPGPYGCCAYGKCMCRFLVQIPSAVSKLASSEDFNGRSCLALILTPWPWKCIGVIITWYCDEFR